jgi:hypothetical protein
MTPDRKPPPFSVEIVDVEAAARLMVGATVELPMAPFVQVKPSLSVSSEAPISLVKRPFRKRR